MLEYGFARPSVITRLRRGPLGPHLETLATILHQHGYTRNSIRGYLRACAQFGRWLAQQGYTIADVEAPLVTRYLRSLPPPPVGRSPKAAAGLPHLLTLWQQQGLLPPAGRPPLHTAAAHWLEQYTQYLEHVCGAAASTCTRYRRIITRFLSACGDTGPQGWSALQAQNITAFIHQEAATTHGAGRKMPSVAVRSFLRFLVGCGELSPGLEAAVPTPRQWTHAPLPQRLTAEEVDRVLVASTGETPKALRNHALLLLLARLGLRAHEVASLCLDDLDWHEGRVLIRPGKTHQARVLPLVQDVGQAVAAYLHRGRPATTSRHVFLACRAPFQPLTDATAISRIATRALRRAGVTGHLRLGAHTFRHTAASQMVNRGASFKEVADVLGHRSLQTTGIYAKLDLDTLVAVALPWMGETLCATVTCTFTLTRTSECDRPWGFRCEPSVPSCATLCATSRRTRTRAPSVPPLPWIGPVPRQPSGGPGGAAQRLSMARGFLMYLRSILPETEVPDSGLVRAFRRPKPYLFTASQITALSHAAQDFGPHGSLRPHTFATFLGVVASTGLRVGEAIRLTVQDVHLDATPPVLHIRETKFHKSRLVPLHPTTVVPLRHYTALRTTLHYAALSDVFFVSEQGQALTHDALGRWFAQLCRQLGLAPTAGGRRPSLHALRHAFAIERLRRWHQDGADVQTLLPHLSVYLGHVRPQESYWYLTATPELLRAAALRFQQYASRGDAS